MIGAVLAGGLGRRMAPAASSEALTAVSKAAVTVAGRPLISYPLAALRAVCSRVVVVCKRETALPEGLDAERWNEPDEPRHPLAGILHALERAEGSVLVCAADMPFVTAPACRALLARVPLALEGRCPPPSPSGARRSADVHAGAPSAVVATGESARLEPLLGVYLPDALAPLRAAPHGAPLRRTVASLEPVRVPIASDLLRSLNTPVELAAAEAELARAGASPGATPDSLGRPA